MRIGEIYRYSRPYSATPPIVDGFPNYFATTHAAGQKLPLLEKGINPIQTIRAVDGARIPAILISSSPHKIGSEQTPWQDYFDPDNGHIRYYGDNRLPGKPPSSSPGNAALIKAYRFHSALEPELRRQATPILFFRRVAVKRQVKGFIKFQGYGIIERVSLVSQYDRKNDRTFPNYAFDFAVLDIATEFEEFSWDWISSRRNPDCSSEQTLPYAPKSWKAWLAGGSGVLDRCRRRISKLSIISTAEQKPGAGSIEAKVLAQVYDYYKDRQSRFESLAAVVTQRILSESGVTFKFGWITRASGDNGIDFVGRLDLGEGFSKVKIVVLGQAKCEHLNSPTNGVHIARTVARLRRGWIGVYVTTSYFSDSSQQEILEDEYPILKINGLQLARVVNELASEAGHQSVQSYLDWVDSQHEDWLQTRDPEEILQE